MYSILERINRAGLKFLESLTLEETLTLIIKEAMRLVDADWGSLHLRERGKMLRAAKYPTRSSLSIEPRRSGYTYRSYAENKPFIVNEKEMLKAHPELAGRGYQSAIIIPLGNHDKRRRMGALILLSKEKQKFSEKEQHLLKVFGSYASLSLRKAKLIEEVRTALKARDTFIAMAAHEIRTPLTTVNGYAQLLQRKLANGSTVEARWTEKLVIELGRLSSLLNELLEVSRVKESQLRYAWQQVHLRDIVTKSRDSFQATNPERKIILRDELKNGYDLFIGDSQKILQALDKLVDNALKFSSQNSDTVILMQSQPRFLLLSVSDQGEGIDQQHLPKVFDRFFKSARNEEKGMGLGLFLARNIVKAHKGTISIKSKVSQGTTVTIKLLKAQR